MMHARRRKTHDVMDELALAVMFTLYLTVGCFVVVVFITEPHARCDSTANATVVEVSEAGTARVGLEAAGYTL